MNDLNVTINNMELRLKEYSGNRSHFIDCEDFFKIKCSEVRPFFGRTLLNGFNQNTANQEV